MKLPELFRTKDYIWHVFCYRVDATVSIAMGDLDNAEIFFQKARDIVRGYGWKMGYGVISRSDGYELEFREFLGFYPEYLEVFESGLHDGQSDAVAYQDSELMAREKPSFHPDHIGSILFHSGPLEGGGHAAYNSLPSGYDGPCAIYDSANEKFIACVPHRTDALSIAAYCISPDGGWCQVDVRQASFDQITHEGLMEWIIG